MTAITDTKTLKAGDQVIIAFSSRDVRRQRATVKSVSETGVTTVASGSAHYYFNRDGRQRGGFSSTFSVIKWLETV